MTAVSYRIRHETLYQYSTQVVHAHHLLHLTPREFPYQKTLTHEIDIRPAPGSRNEDLDAFGNVLMRVELDRPHGRLDVIAGMNVEVLARPDIAATGSLPWERVRDELSYCSRPRTPKELEALVYRTESPHARIKNAFSEFAAECFPKGRPVLVCAEALMRKLYKELAYAPGTTNVGTPLLAVLEARRGVCQDFSHLMIACLRSQGLAARYVSGYLRTARPDDPNALVGADASHAWVSVYAPPFDWVDLDPTNGIRVDTDHVTLAWGRDFGDVSPLRGVIVGGGQHTVSVAVTVTALSPLKEKPSQSST